MHPREGKCTISHLESTTLAAYKRKNKSSIEDSDLGRCVVPRQRNGKILQFSHNNPLSINVLTFFSWDNPAKPPKSLYGDTVFVGQNSLKPRFLRFRSCFHYGQVPRSTLFTLPRLPDDESTYIQVEGGGGTHSIPAERKE